MRSRRWRELGLAALAIGLSLSCAELLLRFLYPAPYYGFNGIRPQQMFFQYDPILGWKGRPNARGVFAGKDFRVTVTHDALGYRNRSDPFVEGRESVLVVGDSYGWGWGVEDDEVFTALVNRWSERYNLYNLSAPGYGTDQELLTLERFLRIHPDRRIRGVVLLFYPNDFLDVVSTSRYTYPKPRFALLNGDLALTNVPVPDTKRSEYDQMERRHSNEGKRGVLNSSHLYNLAFHAYESYRRPPEPAGDRRMPEAMSHQRLVVELLGEMNDLCASRSAAFHVVFLEPGNVDEAGRHALQRLGQRLDALGIGHSSFESSVIPSTDLWLDAHYSRYGHERLASHVLEIIDRGPPW